MLSLALMVVITAKTSTLCTGWLPGITVGTRKNHSRHFQVSCNITLSRQSARRIGKQGVSTAVCASADQKNILLRAQRRTTLCSFLCTAISTNFFLSLSILSFFAYSLIYSRFFFFLFLHKVPKSSLALAYNNRCPSISPRALTNATRETCSHFLWGSENKIRSMAHTDTHAHIHPTYVSRVYGLGGWRWWWVGGQRWK